MGFFSFFLLSRREGGPKKRKEKKIPTLLHCCQHKQWIQGGSSGVKVKRRRLTAGCGVSGRVDDVSGEELADAGGDGRASQLEKKGLCAEGGMCNYPHLCPAAAGGGSR